MELKTSTFAPQNLHRLLSVMMAITSETG